MAYFYRQLMSDHCVDLSDHYVDILDHCVDMSAHYVDMSAHYVELSDHCVVMWMTHFGRESILRLLLKLIIV